MPLPLERPWKISHDSRSNHKYSQAKDMVPCKATHTLPLTTIYSQFPYLAVKKGKGQQERKKNLPQPSGG